MDRKAKIMRTGTFSRLLFPLLSFKVFIRPSEYVLKLCVSDASQRRFCHIQYDCYFGFKEEKRFNETSWEKVKWFLSLTLFCTLFYAISPAIDWQTWARYCLHGNTTALMIQFRSEQKTNTNSNLQTLYLFYVNLNPWKNCLFQKYGCCL